MKAYFLLFVSLVIWGCSNTNQGDRKKEVSEESFAVNTEVIDVVDLLADPGKYMDKKVSVAGTVVHVCKHSGKRLHLMGKDDKTRIRVESGEIGQFDRELEGSEIVVAGVFYTEVIDEEYLAKWSDELGIENKGRHKSSEEQEEDKGKIRRYREMMKETGKGRLENFWVEGISFEIVVVQ